MSGFLANVGKAVFGRFIKEGGVKIAGRTIASQATAQTVAGGATLALAGKGALDVVGGPQQQSYSQYRGGAYGA